MKIGVQLYTLRNYAKGESGLESVFSKVREMGYDTVQYSGCPAFPEEIKTETLKKIADANGINICLTHVPVEKIFDQTEKTAEEHLKLGCPTVGLGGMPRPARTSPDELKKFIEKMNVAADKLSEFGLGLAYHHHDFEFNKCGDERIFDTLIREFDKKIFFTVDTYWAKVGGEEPVAWMQKLDGRIRDLHIKDWTDKVNFFVKFFLRQKQLMCPVGAGKLDFKSIFAEGKKQGVKTALIELDIAPKPYVALQQSTDYLNKLFPDKSVL